MTINAFIDGLIYPKDKVSIENQMKGRFFVASMLLFIFLILCALLYFPIYAPDQVYNQPILYVFNSIMVIVSIGLLFLYKKKGGRVLITNIITFFGYVGSFGVLEGAGIYAPDNMWGAIISVWVFLVANRVSGIFWMILTIFQCVFLFYADTQGWADYQARAASGGSAYYLVNLILAALFLLIIMMLYEKGRENSNKLILSAKAELEEKSKELEVKNKDVTDSINYAKRIQYAVLPQEETIYRSIPLSFIFYKPKDIVSGDFFWFHELNKDEYVLVCADCTGHGVPGAFMTVIGSSLLNQTVIDNKIYKPSDILIELDNQINFTLKQQKDADISVQDGMDLTLIKVNRSKKELVITSAKRPFIFIRNKELKETRGSKFSLGGLRTGEKTFEEHTINYEEDDILYLFTDGYADQFGGEKAKKFSSKRLRELLQLIHRQPMGTQKDRIATTIAEWQGSLEQVDDMLVMGIKF